MKASKNTKKLNNLLTRQYQKVGVKKAGLPMKCNIRLQLDGFIAEEYHAQTFKLNATVRGSYYRVRVLKPEGEMITGTGSKR